VGETITVCSGTIIPRSGCIDIPIVSDTCRSFTGGLTFLNNQVSNASVPLGYVCTFFECDFYALNRKDSKLTTRQRRGVHQQ
jgi:hypothetical protein